MGGKKVFELTLEIGHKSQLLKSQLPNGYTHKWSIFVKGANNSKPEHCIQRVVFKLHDSFPNPHREITEPPYHVKETGYAGFEIPIEIYFKSRDRIEPVEFGLDLILLTDRPNQISRLEKLKFYSPSREFERCLVKAGAQLLSVTKNKKDRSVSPPTKKQKSYSLIPSKDMSNKQAGQQAQSHSQSNNTSHSHSSSASLTSHNSILPSSHQTQQQQHHPKSNSSSHLNHNYHGSSYNNQSHSNNNHTNIGNNNSNSGSNSLFGNSHQSNHQTIKRSSQQPSSLLPKPKSSSSELMDVFGAPLVYNNNKSQKTSNGKDHSSDHNNRGVPMITSNSRSPIPPPAVRQPSPQVPTQQSHTSHQSHSHHHKSSKHNHHHKKHHHIKQESQAETLRTPPPPPPALSAQLHARKKTPQKEQPSATASITQADPFQIIQNKISSLADNDRLQKIVDIIEESGEWFNLTPNKFEFDLKRLDKKTLSRIEKCLS